MIEEYIPNIKIKYVDSPIMNQLSYSVSSEKSIRRGFVYQDNLKDTICETVTKLSNINCSVPKQNLERSLLEDADKR